MSDDVLGHIAYKIQNAKVLKFPFPHIYVENVFPDDYYDELLAALPPQENYSKGESNYKGRIFYDPVDIPLLDPLRTNTFTNICTKPFKNEIFARLGSEFPAHTDLRLVLDGENYAIGPHTDAKWKVLSYLFYLPPDRNLIGEGTSIFMPRDPNFRCEGGPHHKFEPFVKIATMPFKPNSLFAFFKTNNSFHGVEPITIPCRRDLLLWNLYDASEMKA